MNNNKIPYKHNEKIIYECFLLLNFFLSLILKGPKTLFKLGYKNILNLPFQKVEKTFKIKVILNAQHKFKRNVK